MSEWIPEHSGRGGASVGSNGVCEGQLRAGSTASQSVASGAVTLSGASAQNRQRPL